MWRCGELERFFLHISRSPYLHIPPMTLYLPILFESAWVASIIPLSSEPTFFAMKAFGGFNIGVAFVLAVIGASAGQAFNWAIGRLLITLKNRGIFKISEDDYA